MAAGMGRITEALRMERSLRILARWLVHQRMAGTAEVTAEVTAEATAEATAVGMAVDMAAGMAVRPTVALPTAAYLPTERDMVALGM